MNVYITYGCIYVCVYERLSVYMCICVCVYVCVLECVSVYLYWKASLCELIINKTVATKVMTMMIMIIKIQTRTFAHQQFILCVCKLRREMESRRWILLKRRGTLFAGIGAVVFLIVISAIITLATAGVGHIRISRMYSAIEVDSIMI